MKVPVNPTVCTPVHRTLLQPFRLLGALALFVSAMATHAETWQPLLPLAPDRQQARILDEVLDIIRHDHFSKVDLRDAPADALLDAFLQRIDPATTLFTEEDFDGLSKPIRRFGRTMKKGDTAPLFALYNHARQARYAMLEYQHRLVSHHDFDYQREEFLQLDRDNAPRFRDRTEQYAYFHTQVKNAILQSLVEGSEDEDAIRNRLARRYLNRVTVLRQQTSEDIMASFINALLSTLDPHTSYLTVSAFRDFMVSTQLKLEGIGAVLTTRDDYVEIVRLTDGGPAMRSGQLAPTDRIIGVAQGNVDFIDIVGMPLDKVVKMIRGEKGTEVRLEVVPAASAGLHTPRIVRLLRDVIRLEDRRASADTYEVESHDKIWRVGVIKLTGFYGDYQAKGDASAAVASQDVYKLLLEFENTGVDGMILDLRGNGGGFLQEAVNLAGLFLPPGQIVQIRGREGDIKHQGKLRNSYTWDKPMAVLVDRLSASASEIVAAAMQDYARGLIIGERTYGKGTVQAPRPIRKGEGGRLYLTQSKFYRVTGASTQHAGVAPDVALPEIWDASEIGESTLDNPLPWDQIKASKYNKHMQRQRQDEAWEQALSATIATHQERRNKAPYMVYFKERRALGDYLKSITEVPLQYDDRRARLQRIRRNNLDIENHLRALLGKPPFATWQDYEQARREQSLAKPVGAWSEEDVSVQREAARILVDWIGFRSTMNTAGRDKSTS